MQDDDVSTLPHLIDNQMQMMIDHAVPTAQNCISAVNQKYNAALDTVDPTQELVVPNNAGAAGTNLAGIEVSLRDGVEYYKSLVPDFLIALMNRLFGLGDILRPTMEKSTEMISEARFELSKAWFKWEKTLDFAFKRNDEMAATFNSIKDYTSVAYDQPKRELRVVLTKMMQAVKELLTNAPPNKVQALFAATVPLFQEAILSATTCIQKMPIDTARGIVTGLGTAVNTYNNVFTQTQRNSLLMAPQYSAVSLTL